MKKIVFILFLLALTNLYATDYHFTVTEDIDVENDKNDIFVPKNTLLTLDGQKFHIQRYEYYPSISIENGIFFYIDYDNERFLFNEEYLEMQNCVLETPKALQDSYWIMSYYYELLEKQNLNILLEKEPYSHLKPQFFEENTNLDEWKDYFIPLSLIFGKYCLLGNQNNFQASLLELLFIPESYKNNVYTVTVQDITHNNFYDTQYQWRRMFKNKDCFKLFFILDDDYLYVYENEISDTSLLFELAKANDNTIEQIKRFVKTGECDINSINFPKHNLNANSDNNGNITVQKTMIVKENLKLRRDESTLTEVITVMTSGTKVKILEIGKTDTIENIQSSWVKVEILPEGKDKNGYKIKSGTIGWCFGGYLK